MTTRLLSPELAARMAAVKVERPASIVNELIENTLNARASQTSIAEDGTPINRTI